MTKPKLVELNRTNDLKLLDLLVPSEYLTQSDCEPGAVYWGLSRSIGEVAICQSSLGFDTMKFEGLRSKRDKDSLFCEYHYDADKRLGTFRPLVEIDKINSQMSTEQKMCYILDKAIEIQELKLDWLNNLPARLELDAEWLIDEVNLCLNELTKLSQDGFSKQRTISFKDIMQNSRKTNKR